MHLRLLFLGRFGLGLLALLAGGVARAQGNDRSAPTGGRSALMGNTGVALGADGAAPFMNPATIVRINDQALAFSVNFYQFSATNFSNWHQPGQVDTAQFGNLQLPGTAIGTNGFSVVPSTLCLFFTLSGLTVEEKNGALKVSGIGPDEGHRGRQKLAACVGNVESSNVSLAALGFHGTTPYGSTAQVQSLSSQWNRLHIGPTYSIALSDDLAVGMSLHAVATGYNFAINGSSISSTSTGAIQTALGAGAWGNSIELTPILGTTYRLGPITLGLSGQLPSLHIYGAYNGALHNQYASATSETATLTSGTGSFTAMPPVRLSFGAGGTFRKLTLEVDTSFDFPNSAAISTGLHVNTTTLTSAGVASNVIDSTYTVPTRAIWNTAVGGEYFVTPGFSVVGGVSTNLSTISALTPSQTLGNIVQQRVNSVSVSLGIGSYGSAGDILIGTQLGYGWGQALAVNPYIVPNDWAIVDTQTFSAMLILAGATNLRAIGRAVERVENVVTTGRPEDTPAPAKK